MTPRNLTVKQKRFVKNVVNSKMNYRQAARAAGYAESSLNNYLYEGLLRNQKIVKALEDAGLTDESMAEILRSNITAGAMVKATASDSLRGLELVYRLKGALDKGASEERGDTNIYINELKVMSNEQLMERAKALDGEIVEIGKK